MHIGRVLTCPAGDLTIVFSDWMPRGGDNGVFKVELIQAIDGASLQVDLWHKNSEESGPGSSKGTVFSNTSSPGMDGATLSGLKELVRYQFIATGDSVSASILYRVFPPTWFDAADAT